MPRNHTHYDENDVHGLMNNPTFREMLRNDADGVALGRELDYVKSRAYDVKYTELSGMRVVPVTRDVPVWAESYTYRMWDEVGYAKIISNYADDLPRVDIYGKEFTARVRTIGDAYGYNLQEMRATAHMGIPLDTRRATAARRAQDRKLNNIIWTGDADYGMQGVLTHPNLTHATASVKAAGGTAWDKATGLEMYTDVANAINGVAERSQEIHRTNRVVLTSRRLTRLQQTFLQIEGSGALTVFAAIQQNFPGVTFDTAYELVGKAAGGTDMMIAGDFDADNLSHEMVEDFNQLAAQARNLEWVVNCISRTGGVNVRFPMAYTIVEGI